MHLPSQSSPASHALDIHGNSDGDDNDDDDGDDHSDDSDNKEADEENQTALCCPYPECGKKFKGGLLRHYRRRTLTPVLEKYDLFI